MKEKHVPERRLQRHAEHTQCLCLLVIYKISSQLSYLNHCVDLGIILHGAKLLYAYCEATVPRVTVITRKAYGGAYDVMSSKHLRGDINLAFPTAEIAVMGPDGAVNIVNRKEIQNAKDPVEEKAKLVEEYKQLFANPYRAANLGYIDEVLKPEDTRIRVIRSFEMLEGKRQNNPPKKHGLIPL